MNPLRRVPRFDERRFSPFAQITMAISTVLIIVALFGGGLLYWLSERPSYSHVYAFGIVSRPSAVELQPQVQSST
jgi:hypothetical protein